MLTPFKSDLIYHMNHMLTSDTEPSSVILIRAKQLQSDDQKVPKHA